MPILAVVAAVGGAIFGVLADRFSARWFASAPMADASAADALAVDALATPLPTLVRRPDLRTVVLATASGASFAALATRWSEPRDVAVLGVYFAALMLLAATDLDQKLLPDLITLPLMGYALIVLLIGWDPLLADKGMGLVSGFAAALAAPGFLLLTDRLLGGALGLGDVKLAVSLGLMSGLTLIVGGFLIASVASSVVLLVLIALRRLGLRSAIPFGPILIAAGVVAALLP